METSHLAKNINKKNAGKIRIEEWAAQLAPTAINPLLYDRPVISVSLSERLPHSKGRPD